MRKNGEQKKQRKREKERESRTNIGEPPYERLCSFDNEPCVLRILDSYMRAVFRMMEPRYRRQNFDDR